ncbi:LuxR C-terminal-related transcriptional regulator [Noviherbaspirillum autotrophicum]|uniref:LuxR C-terminal-related transcriptional regulator n=1 Tax=Noviherbaspirillum autotrophicum TaxID=709839 RepID=UPI0005895909|nr:LuxR C-terminal-related transcriptional regulator [Noviherbaspirillum autotrophicum]
MNQLSLPSRGHVVPTGVAAAAIALNATKFQPPVANQCSVARELLLARLERQADFHLAVLLAPAGYGKTTLMGQWMNRLQQRRCHASWLTLDHADNDPARLMCYLYGALHPWMQAVAPGSAEVALLALSDWMSVLDRVGPDTEPLTLFLDEFEQLTSASSMRVVKLLVERLPRQVRLVIGSRDKPALGLERYRVRGELLELTVADLRFDSAETARFLSGRVADPIGSWTIEKIQAVTAGWPAALQLTALAIRNGSDLERYAHDLSGSLAHIADYLADDVLNAQSSEVRAFLLETCALPRLCADVCDVATGRSDARYMLQYLERHGLFTTPVDNSGNWYRYHPLFAEFLRGQQALALPPQKVRDLHRSAARWFARHGATIEAVDLWLLAGDHAAAMREMTSCARELVMQAQFGIILRWLDRLSDEAIDDASPELMLAAAWACGFTHQAQAALRWLDRLAPALGAASGTLHDEWTALRSILMALCGDTRAALAHGLAQWKKIDAGHRFAAGALANVISYCLMLEGDFARARTFSEHARRCNEEIGSALGLGYAMALSGLIEAIQGNLERALEQCREVGKMASLRLRQPWFDPSHVNVASVGLIAGVLYEKDCLDEAEELLRRYLPLIAHQPSLDMQLFSYLVKTRVKAAQGDIEAALATLDEAASHCAAWPASRALHVIEWERVHLGLSTGQAEAALAHAAGLERMATCTTGGHGHSYVEELFGAGIETIRCAIARGDVRQATQRLEHEIACAKVQGRRWRLLKLALLQVLALDAAGACQAAHVALVKALQLGAAIGARRSFAENGARIGAMLSALPPQLFAALPDADAVTAYWRDLRGQAPCVLQPATGANLVLSERERAILQLLATGMGNEQLARAVFLSVNTVKWHVRRILEKLDARNRSEAVFIARNRGLIDT